MKKFFLMLLMFPAIGFAQDKNIVSIDRYFPKSDKVQQFEKALTAHAQKFHTGDVSWKVFTIQTGPDAGGYQVLEGPTSWDGLDKRGDISKAHMDDWNTNLQPLLTDKGSSLYLTYRADLSTIMQTDYSDKVAVNHIFYKPGYYGDMENMIKDLKKAWVEGEQSVAVYEASSSGEPQFVIATRYKNGLKDRVSATRPAMPVLFAKANGGESAWTRYLENYKQAVSHQWGEMLFFKPELGSKQ